MILHRKILIPIQENILSQKKSELDFFGELKVGYFRSSKNISFSNIEVLKCISHHYKNIL